MSIAFIGVIIIGVAKPMEQPDDVQNMKYFGIMCSLTVSVAYAIVNVLTRSMQTVHYSIILFYYAVFSQFAMWAVLLIESYYTDKPLRVLAMTW